MYRPFCVFLVCMGICFPHADIQTKELKKSIEKLNPLGDEHKNS